MYEFFADKWRELSLQYNRRKLNISILKIEYKGRKRGSKNVIIKP